MGLKDIARSLKLKVQLRKVEWPSYTVSGIFSVSRRVLVLLPPRQKDAPDIKALCSELGRLFKDARFSIIAHPENVLTQEKLPRTADRLKPELSELTWSGLPRRDFIEKIKKLKADLLIDLSVNKDPYNAYITACSKVPIRIGNYGSWGNPLYNLQIKTNYLQNEQLIGKSIIEVLKDFRAGVNN